MSRHLEERMGLPDVLLVSGEGPAEIVAVMQAEDRDTAICWWNRHVVRGVELYWIRLWAIRRTRRGQSFATMRLDELSRLRDANREVV